MNYGSWPFRNQTCWGSTVDILEFRRYPISPCNKDSKVVQTLWYLSSAKPHRAGQSLIGVHTKHPASKILLSFLPTSHLLPNKRINFIAAQSTARSNLKPDSDPAMFFFVAEEFLTWILKPWLSKNVALPSLNHKKLSLIMLTFVKPIHSNSHHSVDIDLSIESHCISQNLLKQRHLAKPSCGIRRLSQVLWYCTSTRWSGENSTDCPRGPQQSAKKVGGESKTKVYILGIPWNSVNYGRLTVRCSGSACNRCLAATSPTTVKRLRIQLPPWTAGHSQKGWEAVSAHPIVTALEWSFITWIFLTDMSISAKSSSNRHASSEMSISSPKINIWKQSCFDMLRALRIIPWDGKGAFHPSITFSAWTCKSDLT